MKRCKVCGESDPDKLVKYAEGKYRNKCAKHHHETTYTNHILKVYEKAPWTIWSCHECDTMNSKLRVMCRGCKERTREESIKQEEE